ncbi:MAG TPA: hypothetical protein VJA94_18125 [Candidatus Angelobacter sp.]
MPHKTILLLFTFVGCAAFAQSPSISPSQKEMINQLESRPPASASSMPPAADNVTAKEKEKAAPPEPADNRSKDATLGSITSTALNQRVTPATALSNDDLLAHGKTIYVVTHSFFVKKEQLERGLINRKELADWGFHVVEDEKHADFVLSVKRAPFQNNFPFTLTDRASGIVLLGGTVNSLFGTVPGKIAGRLADKFKEVYQARATGKPGNRD